MGKRGVGLLYGAPVHDDVSWVEWYEALPEEHRAGLNVEGCRCTRPLRFAHLWEANPPLVGFWIKEDLDGFCERIAHRIRPDQAIRLKGG